MRLENSTWLLLLLLNSIMIKSELQLFTVIQYSTQNLNSRQNGRLKKKL